MYTKLLKKEIDLFNINIINSNDYRKVNEIYTRTPVDGVKEYLTILQDKCIFQVFINESIDIPIKIGKAPFEKVVGHVKAPESYYEIELRQALRNSAPTATSPMPTATSPMPTATSPTTDDAAPQ